MRYRVTFLAGLAVGFVLGTRAGRETYEQMKKTARQVVQNPTVQRTARTAGAKATELTKAAGQKASERMPKITETAKSSANKMRGQLDRMPGRHTRASEPAAGNGTRPDE